MRPWAEAGRRVGLPALAVLVAAVSIGGLLAAANASGTLGYDFDRAYGPAATRLLAGAPVYDLSFTNIGPEGLFDYPLTFLLAVVPFVAVAQQAVATVLWTGAMVVALLAGVAVLPVRPVIRWSVLLLASLSWPVVYSLKLGQVGSVLFLLFAIGWRFLRSDATVGAVVALGTAIKLQPALLFIWALARRRFRLVAIGVATLGVLVAVATVVAGVQQWQDFGRLLAQVTHPVTTPGSLTPGAIAYQLGAPEQLAGVVQAASLVLTLLLLMRVWARGTDEIGYLATVVASQLVSPVLWGHYAIVLMLPVAWFLDRGIWAAALIPLAVAWPLTSLTPAAVYPVLYAAVLVGLLAAAESRPTLRPLRVARA